MRLPHPSPPFLLNFNEHSTTYSQKYPLYDIFCGVILNDCNIMAS